MKLQPKKGQIYKLAPDAESVEIGTPVSACRNTLYSNRYECVKCGTITAVADLLVRGCCPACGGHMFNTSIEQHKAVDVEYTVNVGTGETSAVVRAESAYELDILRAIFNDLYEASYKIITDAEDK